VFENRVLRRIFGPKRDEVTGRDVGGNYIMKGFITCSKYNWNDQVKESEMGRACSVNGGEGKCR
jgi:hypothetical protein